MNIESTAPIGVIGLGQMGLPMAERLLAAGYRVIGVTQGDPPSRFVEHGGVLAAQVASLAQARIIITMVTDDAATREVALGLGGITRTLGEGIVHVAMGSLATDLCTELASAHKAAEQSFLAAPVFGRPEAAALGALSIVCSGERAAYGSVETLFAPLGQARWIGEGPDLSNLVKSVGNQMIFTAVELLGEIFALFRKAGIAESEVKPLLLDTLFPGSVFAGYAQRIIARDWTSLPGGLRIARKDNAHCLEAAERLGTNLPLVRFLRDRIDTVMIAGGGAVDVTALARHTALQAGLAD